MQIVRFSAFGVMGLAGLVLLLAVADTDAVLFGMAIGLGVSGILLLALDRFLQLLEGIRDALKTAIATADAATMGVVAAQPEPERPTRTAAEISADIRRMQIDN